MNRLQIFQHCIFLAVFVNLACAAIVEVPLDCAGEYNTSDPWTAEIDFGIQFSEISNISVEWQGEITAQDEYVEPQFIAFLSETGELEILGTASVAGGLATYPNPEPFDSQSVFMTTVSDPYQQSLPSPVDWSVLCTGQASIGVFIFDTIHAMGTGAATIGTGRIDTATLVIDGVAVPEPATFIFFGIGCLFLRKNHKK